MQRFGGRCARVVGTLALLGATLLPPGAAAQEAPVDDGDRVLAMRPLPALMPAEQIVLDLTNADRAAAGLPPVVFDPDTLGIARTRAAEQLGTPTLSHYDSRGRLVFAGLLAADGVDYRLAGENLARGAGSASDPVFLRRVDEALMQSPTHRKNILEPSFNQLAVGVAVGGDGQVALAQIFRAAQ